MLAPNYVMIVRRRGIPSNIKEYASCFLLLFTQVCECCARMMMSCGASVMGKVMMVLMVERTTTDNCVFRRQVCIIWFSY